MSDETMDIFDAIHRDEATRFDESWEQADDGDDLSIADQLIQELNGLGVDFTSLDDEGEE